MRNAHVMVAQKQNSSNMLWFVSFITDKDNQRHLGRWFIFS